MSILDYSAQFNHEDEQFKDIYEYARDHHIPIIDRDALNVLKHLIRLSGAKRILEIGSAIGYSAMHMASIDADIVVVTIEKDENRYREANRFFAQYGFTSRIHSICADALGFKLELDIEPFDMVFIDASKGNNRLFFETFSKCIHDSGMIIVDNYYARGIVDNRELTQKRLIKLKDKVHSFNEWIFSLNYHTSFLPVGDGLILISKNKGDRE